MSTDKYLLRSIQARFLSPRWPKIRFLCQSYQALPTSFPAVVDKPAALNPPFLPAFWLRNRFGRGLFSSWSNYALTPHRSPRRPSAPSPQQNVEWPLSVIAVITHTAHPAWALAIDHHTGGSPARAGGTASRPKLQQPKPHSHSSFYFHCQHNTSERHPQNAARGVPLAATNHRKDRPSVASEVRMNGQEPGNHPTWIKADWPISAPIGTAGGALSVSVS